MARVIFGIRNVRVKTYTINHFNITNEEAEAFAVKFEEFDFWNSYKTIKVSQPQIEKRVSYFHFSFIPIFSLGTFWTTRKTDGKLYITTERCEVKINSKLKKVKSPWYAYFGLWALASLLVFGLLFFSYETFVAPKISAYKREKRIDAELKQSYNAKINDIKKLSTKSHIEFENSSFNNNDDYGKVLHINNDSITIGYLPKSAKSLDYKQRNNTYLVDLHLKKYHKLLLAQTISIDSLISLIPKNYKEYAKLYNNHSLIKQFHLNKNLATPSFKIQQHFANKIKIENLGKPIEINDISQIEKNICEWNTPFPIYLDTNDYKIIEPSIMDAKKYNTFNFTIIINDYSNFYEYKVSKKNNEFFFSLNE